MDKAKLLAGARLPEDDVEVPGVGTVRVRGLSRAEAMAVEGCKGTEAKERKIIFLGLLDPDDMSEHEVGEWMRTAPAGELDPVSRRIGQLSGLLAESPKSGLPGPGDEPDAGV
jgi:hypothetical protein